MCCIVLYYLVLYYIVRYYIIPYYAVRIMRPFARKQAEAWAVEL